MKKIMCILGIVLLSLFNMVPVMASESKDIKAIMGRLKELTQDKTISFYGPTVKDKNGAIWYIITYNMSEIYVSCENDDTGETCIRIRPKEMLGIMEGATTKGEDFIYLMLYFVQAVDTSIDMNNAYAHLNDIMDYGTYVHNEIQYGYAEDILTFTIQYKNDIEKSENKENNTTNSKLCTDAEIIMQVQEALNAAGYDCGTPDGIAGNATTEAIKQYQQDNGIDVNGEITDELLNVLLVVEDTDNSNEMPSGMILDEDIWQSWEMLDPCMLYPFMKAGEKAGFSFDLGSDQDENHKVCTFIFKDGDTSRNLEQAELYYGVDKQKITYTGLSTNNESMYLSDDFREACIRLMLGYNIHYDSDTGESVLNLTRERAEEIVNYCFENNIKHCLVDDMRIRLIWNDTADDYYSFHLEYSKDSMNIEDEEETEDVISAVELETETVTEFKEEMIEPETTNEATFKKTESETTCKDMPVYNVSKYVTLGEYKGLQVTQEDISKKSDGETDEENVVKNILIQKVTDNAEISGYPEDKIAWYVDYQKSYYEEMVQMYGMEMSDFLTASGYEDEEAFLTEIEEAYKPTLEQEMVLLAVADAEGMEISDEEFREGLKKYADELAELYDVETTTGEVLRQYGETYVRESLLLDKTLEFLYENAEISEAVSEEETLEAGSEETTEMENEAVVAAAETETARETETEVASETEIETETETASEAEKETVVETETQNVSEEEITEESSEKTTETEITAATADTETEAIMEESGDVATSIAYEFVPDGLIEDFLLDGTYKCGVDFEPGDYFIYGYLGQSPAVKLENAMDEGSYTTGDDLLLKKMSFADSEYIKLYHGAVMFSTDVLEVEAGKEYGIFVVGRDIQSGEYRATTIKNEYTGELGSISGAGLGGIEIYDASLEDKPVYSRRMFEKQTIIELEEGQILILVNVQLEKI